MVTKWCWGNQSCVWQSASVSFRLFVSLVSPKPHIVCCGITLTAAELSANIFIEPKVVLTRNCTKCIAKATAVSTAVVVQYFVVLHLPEGSSDPNTHMASYVYVINLQNDTKLENTAITIPRKKERKSQENNLQKTVRYILKVASINTFAGISSSDSVLRRLKQFVPEQNRVNITELI